MAMIEWFLKGREFGNCNCSYGCPCQFNALPTHGNCMAMSAYRFDEGRFGDVDLLGTEAGTHIGWRLPSSLMPAHNVKAIARTRNIGVYTVQSGGGHESQDLENHWPGLIACRQARRYP